VFGADAAQRPVAWFGLSEGDVFVQPGEDGPALLQNGARIDHSEWVHSGDRIELEGIILNVTLEAGSFRLEEETSAPLLVSPPRPNAAPPRPEHGDTHSVEAAAEPTFAPLPTRSGSHFVRRATLGLFLALLACVGFVLFASPVRVVIEPQPDSMDIEGFPPAFQVGERYLALPGSYDVVAEKEGYHRLEEPIEVDFGSEHRSSLRLEKLPGLIDFDTDPEGAEISVDGLPVGTTPLDGIEVEPGQHEVSVTLDRYLSTTQIIDVEGMGRAQSVEIELAPGWGTLIVRSEPPGAEVWLDQEHLGAAPLESDSMAGRYELELKLEGWKPATRIVDLRPGTTLKLPTVYLEKLDGLLEVTSLPAGATVMLNAEFRGHTPLDLAVVSDVDHQLTLSKAGYRPVSESVRVGSGEVEQLAVSMKVQMGILFVSSKPADARLSVDGKPMGSATRRLKLPTRAHRIQVEKEGYESYRATVTPSNDRSQRIDVVLRTLVEAEEQVREPQVTTAAGQILRRIQIKDPVRFSMGASRRQAGRRANETQHTVELTRSYLLSEKEVTNAEFKEFRRQHDSGSEDGYDLRGANQPVVSVTWDDAARYLNWLSERESLTPVYREEDGSMVALSPIPNGYRFPTEAEWAFAARFEGGKRDPESPLKYPWGTGLPPPPKSGNYADQSASEIIGVTVRAYNDGQRVSAPVGQYPPNGAGLFDLGGNVAEWCHNYYDVHSRGDTRVAKDPAGPASGTYHVLRGASWRHGSITELRLSFRDYSSKFRRDVGFRIARYAD
jgi:formylglycine-generating enzyme required for sulfatase activity